VPPQAAVRAAAAAHPQIQIAETGDATINKAVNETVFRDLRRAEMLSFPITLAVLVPAPLAGLAATGLLVNPGAHCRAAAQAATHGGVV
jgi:RND superfamily putative drug exporter